MKIFISEFQAPHPDLQPRMSHENIQKRTSFRLLLICVQTHIIDLVRASGDALGKVRPATAPDRLPVNAEHTVN
jgi:hypothetical protein